MRLEQAIPRLRESYSPSWREEAEKTQVAAVAELLATQFRQFFQKVDSFGKGSNATVGISGSEAGLVKDIQEDGDKFLRVLKKARIDEGSFHDLIKFSRESNPQATHIAVILLRHILQPHLKGEEKEPNLLRLDEVLLEQQATDHDTHQMKVLWEPYLKMNSSTISYLDDSVEIPKIVPNRKEVVLLKAKDAVDRFVTVQVLVHKLCTVPPWNNIWGAMGIGAFYDRKFDDQDVCYKGMGMASCNHALGYWHYPGMPGCNWWVERFPSERLEDALPVKHPAREWAEQMGSDLLFSSQ